jgi:multiple sugar transport system ATP-binding protein
MNFIKGRVTDGNFQSSGNDLKLKLKGNHADKIKKYTNKELWLGIRPEDIYDTVSTSREDLEKMDVVLDVVEPMGNEIFLYFQLDGVQFVARTPVREEPPAGSRRKLIFDTSKLHFFDADSEISLV